MYGQTYGLTMAGNRITRGSGCLGGGKAQRERSERLRAP
jgi:hypothetical protein